MKRLSILLLAALPLAAAAFDETDLSSGVFILNEDWYGHQNSTINMWYPDQDDPFGNVYYRVFQSKNPGKELGCTAQYAQIFGSNMYIVAKQDRDPGAFVQGGRFTVAEAATLRMKAQYPVINPAGEISPAGGSSSARGDGRGCCGVTPDKIYVGTNNGIYIYTPSAGTFSGPVAGTENPLVEGDENSGDGQGPLYQNQVGMMLRTQDYVFAIIQDRGILVINPVTDAVMQTIPGCFSTMVRSADGDIWAGENIADPNGTNDFGVPYNRYPYGTGGDHWDGRGLLRIDPYTLETERVTITLPGAGVSQSWYAWTAGKMAASARRNFLYFTYADPSDFATMRFNDSRLYRFDTQTRVCELIYDSSADGLCFYGSSLRVSPVDDQLYCTFLAGENIAGKNWVYRRFADSGSGADPLTETAAAALIANYWYPALPVFPDNAAPAVNGMPADICLNGQEYVLTLADKCTDADTPASELVTRLTGNSNPAAVNATIVRGQLVLTGGSEAGVSDIAVQFDSNGRTVDATVTVTNTVAGTSPVACATVSISLCDGVLSISGLADADGSPVHVYNAQGQLIAVEETSGGAAVLTSLPQGLLIVRTPSYCGKVYGR